MPRPCSQRESDLIGPLSGLNLSSVEAPMGGSESMALGRVRWGGQILSIPPTQGFFKKLPR